MLYTCNKTDNPPKPSKKLEMQILCDKLLICKLDKLLIPFVNSRIPEKIELPT